MEILIMKLLFFLFVFSIVTFAQETFPFQEWSSPHWQSKISSAGVTKMIEYLKTSGNNPAKGNLTSGYTIANYDGSGRLISAEVNMNEINSGLWHRPEGLSTFNYENGKIRAIQSTHNREDFIYGANGVLKRIDNLATPNGPNGPSYKMGGSDCDASGRVINYSGDDVETKYSYNKKGFLSKITVEHYDGSKIITTFDYDQHNNLTGKKTNGDGITYKTTISYDKRGLPTKKVVSDNRKGSKTQTFLYYYE